MLQSYQMIRFVSREKENFFMKGAKALTNQDLERIAREEQRAYKKAWRAANPDKVKKHNLAYWQKRAERKLHQQNAAVPSEQETTP